MVKIDRNKIVKAAVGSARLEGYKGFYLSVLDPGSNLCWTDTLWLARVNLALSAAQGWTA